ncbi:hypothetical protein [Ferrimonas senticii]|uniref:hypothetical protein n=1 Tax=Ferrimonas senticii TaxID=394566 RepID=UPI0004841C03|nr:hypothetical protein [Ferrimonas senticii]
MGDPDGISGEVPPPPAQVFENPVSITFESIDSGVLQGTAVSFNLSGEQAASLFVQGATLNGDSYVTDDGSIVLTRTASSSADQFNVELFASVDGFFTTGQSITVPSSSEQANEEFSVVFTPLAPASDDLAIAAVEAPVAVGDDGLTAAAVVIETPVPDAADSNADAVAGGAAQLEIGAGVGLMDAEGEPVTGNITANVVYFSNEPNGNGSNESALDAFPGGLAPDVILDESGEPDPDLAEVVFTSAGFTAIQLQSDSGQVVSEFSEPVDLSFAVSADSVNPDTGELLQTGDEIPLWSFDETSGQWSAEGRATVGSLDADSNTFSVVTQIDHLSYYNLDFYGRRCNIRLNFAETNGSDYAPRVTFTRAGGGWSKSKYISGMGQHTFYRVPQDGIGNIKVLSRSDFSQQLIVSANRADGSAITVNGDGSLSGNFCQLNDATITIDAPDTSALSVALQSRCSDTDEVISQPGVVQVFAQPQNRLMGTITPAADAAATLAVTNGSYQVKGLIYSEQLGEQTVSQTVSVTDDQALTLEFPVDNCAAGTPTGGTGGTGGTGAGGDGDGGS